LAQGMLYDHDAFPAATGAAGAAGRLGAPEYRAWFATLPPELRGQVVDAWGDAPGAVHVDGEDLVFPGLDLGGVLVAVQPPRGFGENPVAVYHSPDLAPTHHYLGFYRWLDAGWGADPIVHVAKPGTLTRLPGKGVGPAGGGRAPARPGPGRAARGRGVRRPAASRGRIPVRAQGRPDPRRAPRAGAGPGGGGRARPGAGRHPSSPRGRALASRRGGGRARGRPPCGPKGGSRRGGVRVPAPPGGSAGPGLALRRARSHPGPGLHPPGPR